jgi:hypothetical protein
VGDEVAAGVATVRAFGRVAERVDGGADQFGLVSVAPVDRGAGNAGLLATASMVRRS